MKPERLVVRAVTIVLWGRDIAVLIVLVADRRMRRFLRRVVGLWRLVLLAGVTHAISLQVAELKMV